MATLVAMSVMTLTALAWKLYWASSGAVYAMRMLESSLGFVRLTLLDEDRWWDRLFPATAGICPGLLWSIGVTGSPLGFLQSRWGLGCFFAFCASLGTASWAGKSDAMLHGRSLGVGGFDMTEADLLAGQAVSWFWALSPLGIATLVVVVASWRYPAGRRGAARGG